MSILSIYRSIFEGYKGYFAIFSYHSNVKSRLVYIFCTILNFAIFLYHSIFEGYRGYFAIFSWHLSLPYMLYYKHLLSSYIQSSSSVVPSSTPNFFFIFLINLSFFFTAVAVFNSVTTLDLTMS